VTEIKFTKGFIKALRHNHGQPVALGCGSCLDRHHCGGMQVSAPYFDCLAHCACPDRMKCQLVCMNKSTYARRIHEVRGFGLDDIEKRDPIATVTLPNFSHLLFTHPKIEQRIQLPVAALPLSKVFNRSGRRGTALTREEVEARFKLHPGTPLILSGVEQDHNIEKLWGVQIGRREMLAGIRAIDPLIVTTPNYSVFLDVPRHDAMYNLKRIVLAWSELHDAGLRTALHLNAVTDHDYRRMAEFLAFHTEINAVSVEYETGAANNDQGEYHSVQLGQLIQRVGRSLHLVFRGSTRWLPSLRLSFPNITVINGAASIKTRKRQRAHVSATSNLRWHSFHTPEGSFLDELLQHNLATVGSSLESRMALQGFLEGPVAKGPVRVKTPRASKMNAEADDKTLQMSLLRD
jgi:hypothetical protein